MTSRWKKSLEWLRRRRAFATVIVLIAFAGGGWWAWRHFWVEQPLRLARHAADQHLLTEAMVHLRTALARVPGDPETLLLAGQVARRLGELDDADAYLQACAHEPAIDGAAWSVEKQLTDIQREGVAADVEPKLVAWAGKHPAHRPLIDEALAEGCLKAFRVPAALAFLDQAIAAQPDNVVALRRRGRLRLQLADTTEAVLDLSRAAELEPEHVDGLVLLADALVKAGRFGEGLPLLERLHRAHTGNTTVLVGLALCRAARTEFEEARSLLLTALQQQPRHAVALLELGRLDFEQGQATAAENWLRQSLDADPTDRRTNHLMYLALRAQGKNELADKQLARARQVQLDLTRLREIMTDELAKRPRDVDLHYELGMLNLRNGQRPQAAYWLEQTLKLDARHRPSHRALAQYYDEAGQPDRAAFHRARQ